MATIKNKTTATSTTTSAKIAAPPTPPAVPTGKLTREEWRALTPEQKAARKLAKAATRISIVARLTRTTGKLARRTARLATIFAGTDAADTFAQVTKLLQAAGETVSELPADWSPKGGAVAGAKFNVGDLVTIHPKRRASFEGLLEADELNGLRITKIVGKRLVCVSESGVKITLASNVITKS